MDLKEDSVKSLSIWTLFLILSIGFCSFLSESLATPAGDITMLLQGVWSFALALPVYQTYQAVGEREDLTNEIVNISPTETPFFTACEKKEASGVFHEWQTDALDTAAQNATVEGEDVTWASWTMTATTRLGNYCQIAYKAFWVSDTMEAVSKAGRDSEYAYQAEKAMKALARDVEFDLIRNASAVGASGTARELNGLFAAIATNTSTGSPDRPLDETLYNDMLQTVFDAGGNPNVTYCNGWQKRQISSFTGATGTSKNIALADRRLINAVDYYESNFGLQKIILDRHVNTDRIALVEQAMMRVAFLRPTHHKPLPDDGGGPRGKIEQEYTLEYGSEASSGEILNLTTS